MDAVTMPGLELGRSEESESTPYEPGHMRESTLRGLVREIRVQITVKAVEYRASSTSLTVSRWPRRGKR